MRTSVWAVLLPVGTLSVFLNVCVQVGAPSVYLLVWKKSVHLCTTKSPCFCRPILPNLGALKKGRKKGGKDGNRHDTRPALAGRKSCLCSQS